MRVDFDLAKDAHNRAKHGLSLDEAKAFEWRSAVTKPDLRYEYGEERFVSYGKVKDRVHIVVWTPRHGKARLISFRKANARERKFYETQTKKD